MLIRIVNGEKIGQAVIILRSVKHTYTLKANLNKNKINEKIKTLCNETQIKPNNKMQLNNKIHMTKIAIKCINNIF